MLKQALLAGLSAVLIAGLPSRARSQEACDCAPPVDQARGQASGKLPKPATDAAAGLEPSGPTDEDPDQQEDMEVERDFIKDGALTIGKVEMRSYDRVLKWVNNQSLAVLRKRARADVPFDRFLSDANKMRFQIVKTDLLVRHVIKCDVKGPGGGELYEIHGLTPQSRLYFGIVEGLPEGMPVGTEVSEKGQLVGYFFKVQGYFPAVAKSNTPLRAPLIIGRLAREPSASGQRDATPSRAVVIYTKQNAPPAPKLEDLPLRESISQYGITWTFDRPARVGRFVNGDWYVVGRPTVKAIDPKPLYGPDIPERELDHMDRERPEGQRVRNGFMLNPPAAMKVAYDSGVRNWFDPALIQKLPVSMKPGDSLVSTISMPNGLVLDAPLRNKIERGVEDSSPIRTAAVLTCVAAPQPADAFRPAFCDRRQKIYLARNLKRDLLPTAAASKSTPKVEQYVRFTQRPWVGTGFFGFEEPVENMPLYGLEYGRVSGMAALLLCTDLAPQQKEPLVLNYVQVGIDLGGMIRAGHPGWTGFGGHGSGRKLPIVFAGLLLGDEQLANINRSFPKASFGEDEQTAYGDCWTGAKVVFAGHSGIDAATGAGRSRGNGWGPYEHTPPAQWQAGQKTSESYRRCCTSVGWVAQALALRLMHAEKAWAHDAFFDYVDRWMYENDAAFVKTIKQATGQDHDKDWARQGQAWDAFTNEMWARHRPSLPAPTDGWQQPHDDSYYRKAIGK
jgi:hypothetical protein